MIRPLLRSIAILIAVLGAIDPALTSERTAPVTISLIDMTPPSASAGTADAIDNRARHLQRDDDASRAVFDWAQLDAHRHTRLE